MTRQRFWRRWKLEAATLAGPLVTSAACVGPRGPTAGSRADTVVAADAAGDRAHPASVRLELEHGALRLSPGAPGTPLVAGRLHVDDPTLAPHVTVNRRGVAIVQDFAGPAETPSAIGWDLTLGSTPVRLDLHVVGSEAQRVDLGGRAVAAARLYNEGGHLALDWSAPSSMPSTSLELWSIGYLEAHHLARSRAQRVEIKSVGYANIDVGEPVEAAIHVDVVSSAGTLVITVPSDAAARAELDAPSALRVETEGWVAESPARYAVGAPQESPRVIVEVRSGSGVLALRVSPRASDARAISRESIMPTTTRSPTSME